MYSRGVFISLLTLSAQLVDSQELNGSALSPYIVNGREALPGQFPYQALVSIGNALCGGSLLSNEYVITAAHCIIGNGSALVILGSIRSQNFLGNEVFATGSKIYKHPFYNPRTMLNDVAIIKLDAPIKFDANIQPIRLPKLMDGFQLKWQNKVALVSGWGVTEADPSVTTSDSLMWASVQVLPIMECRRKLLKARTALFSAICTSTAQSAVCMGDSGGPMVVIEDDGQPTLVGVTSYSIVGPAKDCRTAEVDVFTFTGRLIFWISRIIGFRRI